MNQVSFFIHDGDGRIRQAGSCPADMVQLQRVPGCQTKIGVADLRTQYFDVKAGEIRDMPPRPSEYYVFDYSTKQWVDPRTLDDLKAEKWAEIKRKRDEVEFGGFVWDGSVFDSDALSQSRIQGAVQMAAMAVASGQPFSVNWTLADNTVRTLDAEDMTAVGMALAAHVENCHSIGRQLREAINAAASKEELDEIQWPQV